ncbi:ergothioneine biosynthesis protein EgtB [Ferrimonas marina]|uniref:Ergothioneine biosynthesis protein EgtB n=1 Tax=Ferrimonas marina TaxID=299255 RepID=A0A1M5Z636_9GAMM|nr:ergothioneine biosynthesis protein EgtB [Ferrimonas marina]SHI19670.1 ergothioneine biosynthesis protein EgtB [Ferrimonas marina]
MSEPAPSPCQYPDIRRQTVALTDGLSAEDMVAQSMPDASPIKWHLAHTTWFFEQFILKPLLPGYRQFHPQFNALFNSYYQGHGRPFLRAHRGLLTRPSLQQVLDYRAHVDQAMTQTADRFSVPIDFWQTLGLHHEMQHQELMLTDSLHLLWHNPLRPAWRAPRHQAKAKATPLSYHRFEGGLVDIGQPENEGFGFDCERPRHPYHLQPYRLANRPINNGEWLTFIQDGGYQQATLWLSDGWALAQQQHWQAPLYWEQDADGQWQQFTLAGLQPLDLEAPVSHISYFEADAYARWAGGRLPTEQEWEHAAQDQPIKGNFVESGNGLPQASPGKGMQQLFGDVWEWTQSPYVAYPGFRPTAGIAGEYNGKFMSGQYVLRGGSCATPKAQMRLSYRNFFYPHQRWQFSGMRLAKD